MQAFYVFLLLNSSHFLIILSFQATSCRIGVQARRAFHHRNVDRGAAPQCHPNDSASAAGKTACHASRPPPSGLAR